MTQPTIAGGVQPFRPNEGRNARGSRMAENESPGHEDKAEFRKITVTLPPDAYEQLIYESARRKIAGEPNQLLSSLLREAVVDYLKRLER
jgi:hypothetical protein